MSRPCLTSTVEPSWLFTHMRTPVTGGRGHSKPSPSLLAMSPCRALLFKKRAAVSSETCCYMYTPRRVRLFDWNWERQHNCEDPHINHIICFHTEGVTCFGERFLVVSVRRGCAALLVAFGMSHSCPFGQLVRGQNLDDTTKLVGASSTG